MSDELSLGAAPRVRRRPRRSALLGATGAAVVVAAAVALVLARPWQTEHPVRLAATGATCAVGFGTDLVVVAAQVTNPSATVPVALTDISLADPASGVLRPTGGPIDVVSDVGCEHVLALRGDRISPRGQVWLGLTVRTDTCVATTATVIVTATGPTGSATSSAIVPLAADLAPACTAG